MDKALLALSTVEAGHIWQFFNGVSNAIARRMQSRSTPSEESLTFLLCELLDDNYTSSHVLDYSFADLKADLLSAKTGISVDISVETHEHTRRYESKISNADLGLVLVRNHPIFGGSYRALLLQSKRLFPVTQVPCKFALRSEYRSFKREQLDALLNLEIEQKSANSIYYLWYNPNLSQFADADMEVLGAYESTFASHGEMLAHLGMFTILWADLKWQMVLHSRNQVVEQEDPNSVGNRLHSEWVSSQPALRVSTLHNVRTMAEQKGQPKLQFIYDMQGKAEWNSGCIFTPFADFLLMALFDDSIGSSHEDWINLVQGKKGRSQTRTEDRHFEAEQTDDVIMPKHTITITVASRLPQLG